MQALRSATALWEALGAAMLRGPTKQKDEPTSFSTTHDLLPSAQSGRAQLHPKAIRFSRPDRGDEDHGARRHQRLDFTDVLLLLGMSAAESFAGANFKASSTTIKGQVEGPVCMRSKRAMQHCRSAISEAEHTALQGCRHTISCALFSSPHAL